MYGESPYAPLSPARDSPAGSGLSSPTMNAPLTRTVAIIKTHALKHRFDIEPRISEAGFEIVKERQMEFDTETDPETLYELFGDDYRSFAEGPVWVYVLERRRAVEVWHTVMGDADPEVARQDTPHSLRALYGISREQNAVMGSPDVTTAEIQISAIFASSPPFPSTELPDVGGTDTLRSVASDILAALQNGFSEQSAVTSQSGTVKSPTGSSNSGKSPFKARALPASLLKPDIVPRMSRASALRAGIPIEKEKENKPRAPLTKEQLAKTFANVPGHKRAETISVASTAPPVVAPRMTRAASLRLGQKPPEKPKRPTTAGGGAPAAAVVKPPSAAFDGVPGHKRRESIKVASTKPPTVAPRTNRSAALRQQKEKDAAPPSSFMFRGLSAQQVPSRSSSRVSQNTSGSVREPSRPASAASTSRPGLPQTWSRASRPSSAFSTDKAASTKAETPASENGGAIPATPARPKPRVSTAQAPTITPRTNKSALLRAQKMAAASAPVVPTVKAKAPPAARTVKV
ncbi:hypothetical protein CERSUDRAFT_81183 [Gelatoporia subvermispora B]|uniref:Nucleoside diphosphate kinase n=1 Tax=Ceriporiopsis subvermispora (strain B) TaxID=914234 RepID=M2RLV0_CERS8|nr:hypothetical protein CERSUDRAFT_81183 [Gelatoporia subvermispora B]